MPDKYLMTSKEKGMDRQADAQLFFSEGDCVAPLGLIPLEGARELGEKINEHLVRWA